MSCPESPLLENRLFRLSRNEEAIVVFFQGQQIHFQPDDYQALLSLQGLVQGKEVVLTGIAPCEAYCAAGYYCQLFGANDIIYRNDSSSLPPFSLLHASESSAGQRPLRWYQMLSHSHFDIATMQLPPTGTLWPAEALLPFIVPPAPAKQSGKPLMVTGEGRVFQYAALGILAAQEGRPQVWVQKPTCTEQFYFGKTQTGIMPMLTPDKHGLAVGILGDPNSGKSVFSLSFLAYLHILWAAQKTIWRWDCDLAAPTPEWYLAAMSSGNERLIEQDSLTRKGMKQKWTPALEKRVVQTISNLKENLDVVLADLPGGHHPNRQKGETFLPQRIPGESRAEMLKACDAYVVISRKDQPHVFDAWRRELAHWNLENRIVGHFLSAEYDCPFSMNLVTQRNDGIFQAEINGLNRTNSIAENAQAMLGKMDSFGQYLFNLNNKGNLS